jgi:hypothetical protein
MSTFYPIHTWGSPIPGGFESFGSHGGVFVVQDTERDNISRAMATIGGHVVLEGLYREDVKGDFQRLGLSLCSSLNVARIVREVHDGAVVFKFINTKGVTLGAVVTAEADSPMFDILFKTIGETQ